jgi:hypothetical protein
MERKSATTLSRVILSFNENAPNNYPAWLDSLIDNFGPVYGNLSKVLKTHAKYIVPNVVDEDFMPPEEVVNGQLVPHGLTAGQRMELKMSAIKERNKKVSIHKGDEPKFYDDIWSTIGQNSREKISSHADYAEAYANSDPHPLLAIARKTHLT